MAFFGVAPDSDEPDAHPAHTEHDHRRYEPGEDRAADHQSVGQRLADAMRHHDRTRAGRKMREDEERAEPIMRHQADVPPVLDESGGRARREFCFRRARVSCGCGDSGAGRFKDQVQFSWVVH